MNRCMFPCFRVSALEKEVFIELHPTTGGKIEDNHVHRFDFPRLLLITIRD